MNWLVTLLVGVSVAGSAFAESRQPQAIVSRKEPKRMPAAEIARKQQQAIVTKDPALAPSTAPKPVPAVQKAAIVSPPRKSSPSPGTKGFKGFGSMPPAKTSEGRKAERSEPKKLEPKKREVVRKVPVKKVPEKEVPNDLTPLPTEGTEVAAPPVQMEETSKTTRQKAVIKEAPPHSEGNWLAGVRMQLWQESIPVTRGPLESHFPAQFFGIGGELTGRRQVANTKRFFYHLGLQGAIGVAKASGNTNVFTDRLMNQPWIAGTVSPGFMIRGSNVTQIYLFAPLTYRLIFWKVKGSLKMGRENSFSGGLGLLAANRITPKFTFLAGLVHQGNWESSIWTLGFDFDF